MTTTIDQAPPGYVTVIAYKKGFYGKGKLASRILPKETFFVPEGTRCGSWFGPANPEDAKKLLPSLKPEKQKAQEAANRAARATKDPAILLQQTLRQLLDERLGASQIPAGKVFEPPEQKQPAKAPKQFDNPKA